MTNLSAAQKRKKNRAQKLLEEEQQIVEEEKARQAPVSTPTPLVSPAAPIVAPLGPAINNKPIHGTHDTPSLRAFPPGHPAANWPAHLQDYIYGPVSRSPSPPPSWYSPYDITPGLHSVHNNCGSPLLPLSRDLSWYQDDDNVHTIRTVYTVPSPPAPHDFSALCSTASAHPWHTVRRRNQHLLPQHREPQSSQNQSQNGQLFLRPAQMSLPYTITFPSHLLHRFCYPFRASSPFRVPTSPSLFWCYHVPYPSHGIRTDSSLVIARLYCAPSPEKQLMVLYNPASPSSVHASIHGSWLH
ncbi:hypothetical protein B0H10DRAFT_2223929 [Mycena sp. CBHHK59/15]|nr:hypothetical protein B0H10DRAFT_2223929 [Mycena sp. CBHHK59/15]